MIGGRVHNFILAYCSSDHRKCSAYIADFLRYKEITFASVGTTTDKLVLTQTWQNVNIPEASYVDL